MTLQQPLGPLELFALATALASAVVGGVFFTFSAFVMRALAALPPAEGIAAMQAINRAAVRPPLMLALFGTAAAGAALAVRAVVAPGSQPMWWLIASATYLVGVVGVTALGNVPLNEALARATPGAEDLWRRYLTRWTALNHVRTVAAVVSGASFLVAVSR